MPRSNTRNAQGNGTIRQRDSGLWEARYTVGRDPGTGKQVQKSVYGESQSAVRKKLTATVNDIDNGIYTAPKKLKMSQWLDIWLSEYVANSVKPNTYRTYKTQVEKHLKPAIGSVQLQGLSTHVIQGVYNALRRDTSDKPGLSAKTIKNCHGVLHKALYQAMRLGYIRVNPADACELPRQDKKKISPLDEANIKEFLAALRDEPYKNLFVVALFTGLRQAELLGLQWSCVNFSDGTILVDKQLIKIKEKNGPYLLANTKTDNVRLITPAPTVLDALRSEQAQQETLNLNSYGTFSNPDDLVFTDEFGKHLVARTVVKHFKNIASQIGIPEKRFHDLRHSYATFALKSGDSIKDVQTNLGHTTATITLDLYSHVTADMKRASAQRMEDFIQGVKQA